MKNLISIAMFAVILAFASCTKSGVEEKPENIVFIKNNGYLYKVIVLDSTQLLEKGDIISAKFCNNASTVDAGGALVGGTNIKIMNNNWQPNTAFKKN